ncbi:hypothetical protein M404DRAFT_303200 [Pisolithus tinctorius Marx 270]|uniref:Uncharacterized protein n=1 Tax=Pisolithus tinctorius Marx 270 TaxID=870435 RepID=A0A0C3KHB7_PISTI|nr:hypothetical protein M404DRAFT_303200 [Pisolithus tinctorius Marx 270]
MMLRRGSDFVQESLPESSAMTPRNKSIKASACHPSPLFHAIALIHLSQDVLPLKPLQNTHRSTCRQVVRRARSQYQFRNSCKRLGKHIIFIRSQIHPSAHHVLYRMKSMRVSEELVVGDVEFALSQRKSTRWYSMDRAREFSRRIVGPTPFDRVSYLVLLGPATT